jgi:hypothetical protein
VEGDRGADFEQVGGVCVWGGSGDGGVGCRFRQAKADDSFERGIPAVAVEEGGIRVISLLRAYRKWGRRLQDSIADEIDQTTGADLCRLLGL